MGESHQKYLPPEFRDFGSVPVYRLKRADTKDQTIPNSWPMTPKQRQQNNGYPLVNRYTRTEPGFHCLISNREGVGTSLKILGLASIDPHSRKVQTELYKIPKFSVNRPNRAFSLTWQNVHIVMTTEFIRHIGVPSQTACCWSLPIPGTFCTTF